jgi:hypothetical protein
MTPFKMTASTLSNFVTRVVRHQMLHRRRCSVILLGFGFLHVNRLVNCLCIFSVSEKKLKGRQWKDEISALTSVSLGSSGDLFVRSTEKRGRNHFFEECSFHIPLRVTYPFNHPRESPLHSRYISALRVANPIP